MCTNALCTCSENYSVQDYVDVIEHGLSRSCRVALYRVGQKSKLLILSEYVNKTEKIGGTWTNKNSYRENKVLSDIFSWNILGHCFVLKYFMTESNQWNYC